MSVSAYQKFLQNAAPYVTENASVETQADLQLGIARAYLAWAKICGVACSGGECSNNNEKANNIKNAISKDDKELDRIINHEYRKNDNTIKDKNKIREYINKVINKINQDYAE